MMMAAAAGGEVQLGLRHRETGRQTTRNRIARRARGCSAGV